MHHVVSMSSFMFCFQNLILQRNVKKMLITTVKLEETLSGLQRRNIAATRERKQTGSGDVMFCTEPQKNVF